ncbi:MAG: malonate transporter subunit MadL [Firmicutes bacterium]|jgi:malonate transporter MadL subunit|nr:malonate transporter subunit MadL [Bacillota bacterium]
MEIYGMAVVSVCYLVGMYAGTILARFLGLTGDVGGVGFGMLLLILVTTSRYWEEKIPAKTKRGVELVSALYIPIVVAMVARSDVVAALKGGWIALVTGAAATFLGLLMVPVLAGKAKIQEGRSAAHTRA